MDTFLQTNNDLIISIHKALVESTQEINRKIENLRDDVRDVKLSLAKNDRIMQEEATNWRRHTETIVKELGDRHQSDITGLHNLLMELCIRSSAVLPAPAAPVISSFKEADNKAVAVPAVVPSALSTAPAAPKEVDYKTVAVPPVVSSALSTAPAAPVNFSFKETEKKPSAVLPVVSSTKPSVVPTVVSSALSTAPAVPVITSFKEADNKTSVVPPVSSALSTAPAAPVNFSFKEADNKTVAVPPVVSSAVSTAPAAPVSFSFKTPAVTTTASSFAPLNGGPTSFITPSVPTGGSLFGGASRSGTNTFANLAAKAAETGGGFLGGGNAAAKPVQFGHSAFGATNVKDFKLFQQPPQQSFSSAIHTGEKTADESHRGDEGSDKEDAAEDFVPDVHYEPVVPLPPEVEVSTGEEEEEVVFSARCKLYRFDKDARENKERGLGDIKLLYNPRSKRYRCVMRREQVFKLCANFPIYPDLKIHPREHMPTVYTWACKDFSDDPSQGNDVTLSARFKDKAIADEFYEKMMEAVEKSD